MPVVKSTISIARYSPTQIWPVLIDFTKYPELMENVLSVRILERSDSGMVTAWEVDLDGATFAWTERDTFCAPREVRFEQVEGDLESWTGFWQLEETSHGTSVTLSVDFDIGIPSMEAFLNPLAETAIEENSTQLLDALNRALVQDGQDRLPMTH